MIEGKGELRKQHGRYVGYIVMGGRTIALSAALDRDGDGQLLLLGAKLDNVDTPAEMVRVLQGPVAPPDPTLAISMSDLVMPT